MLHNIRRNLSIATIIAATASLLVSPCEAQDVGPTSSFATGMTVGTTVIGGGTSGKLLFDNSGVLGETLAPVGITSINKVAITTPATNATLTIADGKTLTDTSGVGAVALAGTIGGGFAQAASTGLSDGKFINASAAYAKRSFGGIGGL